MPLDHRVERLDHQERAHWRVLQRRHHRISESQTTYDHVPRFSAELGQPQVGQCDLHVMKQARHEERVPELHLEDLDSAQRQHPAPAQG